MRGKPAYKKENESNSIPISSPASGTVVNHPKLRSPSFRLVTLQLQEEKICSLHVFAELELGMLHHCMIYT